MPAVSWTAADGIHQQARQNSKKGAAGDSTSGTGGAISILNGFPQKQQFKAGLISTSSGGDSVVRPDDLKEQMQKLLTECSKLREENARYRALLGLPAETEEAVSTTHAATSPDPVPAALSKQSPSKAKVALFRSLFRGREDVYAVRWERKDGKSGYSPACRNEWVPGIFGCWGRIMAVCGRAEPTNSLNVHVFV